MHQKVIKLIVFICSTACLYVIIGLSPQNRAYENYKYAKTIFVVNPESEPYYEDIQCCPQLSTVAPIPTPIHQTVSTIVENINDNTIEETDSSVTPLRPTNKQVITPDVKRKTTANKTQVDDYHLNCDIHIAMIFTKIQDINNKTDDNFLNTNKTIDRKLYRSLSSLSKHMNHTTHKVCVHLITDRNSQFSAKLVTRRVLDQRTPMQTNGLRFYFHDIHEINAIISDLLPTLKTYFNYKPNSYYSHSLFFTSMAVHRFFATIDRLIFLDIDLQFTGDIKELYEQFGKFSSESMIGIAYEQQPVYRHILHEYRRKIDNNTKFGSAPPEGLPGFNSGVLLMDLKRLRQSKLYNRLLNSVTIESLCKKYFFSGHLGDQDFYTVVSFEHRQLFHVIPCNWNRQLCQWWRYHGYRDVFEDYFRCDLQIKLFHGNCNSALPSM